MCIDHGKLELGIENYESALGLTPQIGPCKEKSAKRTFQGNAQYWLSSIPRVRFIIDDLPEGSDGDLIGN